MKARIRIEKTGNALFPWEAHCSECSSYSLHYGPVGLGIGVVNSRGVGNRTWLMTLHVALRHLEVRHG